MCPLGYETTPLQCEQPVRCFTAKFTYLADANGDGDGVPAAMIVTFPLRPFNKSRWMLG